MVYATELMGAQAYDVQGNYVGRVREFFVEPAEQLNRIAHFLISRGRFAPLVARYDQVSAVEPGRIQLNVSERALAAYEPNEAWLAVRKDLLDQQIIDTAGRKVVRVNDVDLAELGRTATWSYASRRWMWACRGRCGGCCKAWRRRPWCGGCRKNCHNDRSAGSS